MDTGAALPDTTSPTGPVAAAAAAADPALAADPLAAADVPAPKPAATKPAAKPTTAKPAAADTWQQPDGFVPGVDTAPAVKPPRAAADNSWAITDPSTGTPSVDSVFVDAKYAPKPAAAAAAAADPMAAGAAAAAAPAPVGAADAGGVGAAAAGADVFGLGGGFGGSLAGAGDSAGGLAGGMGRASSSGSSLGSVFTGASDELPNTYKPSVANALGSNDLLVSRLDCCMCLGVYVLQPMARWLSNVPTGSRAPCIPWHLPRRRKPTC